MGKLELRDVCKAWDGAMQMYADEAREEMKKQSLWKSLRNAWCCRKKKYRIPVKKGQKKRKKTREKQ